MKWLVCAQICELQQLKLQETHEANMKKMSGFLDVLETMSTCYFLITCNDHMYTIC